MSIASEISRLQSAKADLKTAIEAKGVTVPSSATLDDYDSLVAAISGGGGSITAATGEFTLTSDVSGVSSSSDVKVLPGLDLDFKPDFLWITMTEASFQSLTDVTNHLFGLIAIPKTAIQTFRFTANSSTASLTKDTMFFKLSAVTTSTDSGNGYMQNGIGTVALASINNEYWKLNDDGTVTFGADGSARLGWYAGTYRFIAVKFS